MPAVRPPRGYNRPGCDVLGGVGGRGMSELPNSLSALRTGAVLVLSISGGKDSDAMTLSLLEQRARENWPGAVCLVHADLGRAEHRVTPQYVDKFHRRIKALY